MKIKNLILGLFLMALFTASCSKSDDSPELASITVTPSNVLSDSVTVQWPAVAGAFFYDVDVYKGEEYLEDLSYAVENKTEYIIKGLLANTEYKFVVTANNTSGEAAAEGNVTVTTTAVLAGLVGTWQYTNSPLIIKYVFNANGTGSYKYDTSTLVNFTWKVKSGKILLSKTAYNIVSKQWLNYSPSSDNSSATIGNSIFLKQ